MLIQRIIVDNTCIFCMFEINFKIVVCIIQK